LEPSVHRLVCVPGRGGALDSPAPADAPVVFYVHAKWGPDFLMYSPSRVPTSYSACLVSVCRPPGKPGHERSPGARLRAAKAARERRTDRQTDRWTDSQTRVTRVLRAPGELLIPHDTLYKKNVLLVRGRFRPFTLLHNDMLVGAAEQFFCTTDPKKYLRTADSIDECVFREDTLVLLEMTTRDMMEVGPLPFEERKGASLQPCVTKKH
jgi:hypothetical protein